MTRNGEPAVKPLKVISIALLGLLLVMLGALSLYQGIAEEAPLWLPWVRGSLAIVSGLGLVVLSLNRSRCIQAFILDFRSRSARNSGSIGAREDRNRE